MNDVEQHDLKTFSRPGTSWIWKKPQKPGKIVELKKKNLGKTWNFFSDLKHCETNWSCASRTLRAHFKYMVWKYHASHLI